MPAFPRDQEYLLKLAMDPYIRIWFSGLLHNDVVRRHGATPCPEPGGGPFPEAVS